MSKAPETIYITPNCAQHTFKDAASRSDTDVSYVRGDIAYGYARQVEQLRSALREIAHNASIMTTHGIETMARDALTKEG